MCSFASSLVTRIGVSVDDWLSRVVRGGGPRGTVAVVPKMAIADDSCARLLTGRLLPALPA